MAARRRRECNVHVKSDTFAAQVFDVHQRRNEISTKVVID